jgi:hypothetical protein
MIFDQAAGAYKGMTCPKNTYGVAAMSFGLSFMPCKPCPRGLYTTGTGSTSEDACKNLAGYGFNGFTAEACPPGYYAAADTKLPCQQCPPFRNTTATTSPFFNDASVPAGTNGDAQDAIGDCKVIPGYGIPSDVTPTGDDAARAVLDTVECPMGTFSLGGAVDTQCTSCTSPATTSETGLTSCDGE